VNFSSPYIAPILLSTLVAISLIAVAVQSSRRRKMRHALRALASEWRMTYASHDRLRISEKIHNQLPIPGAAALSVCDVVYGAQAGELRCVFTVEFTIGVIRRNSRVRRVGSLIESRDPGNAAAAGVFNLAPDEVPLIEQYRSLDPRGAQKTDSAPSGAESGENPISNSKISNSKISNSEI
jgi:hypothetical protein